MLSTSIYDESIIQPLKDLFTDSIELKTAVENSYLDGLNGNITSVPNYSFPSNTDVLAIIRDSNKLTLLTIHNYIKLLFSKETLPQYEIVQVSPLIGDTDLFKYSGSNYEEKKFNKLVQLLNISEIYRTKYNSTLLIDYVKLFVTEYMSPLAYGLYVQYNVDLKFIAKYIITKSDYKHVVSNIDILVVATVVKEHGKDCHIYNDTPKYKLVPTYFNKGIPVPYIMKKWKTLPHHMVLKDKLAEVIKGKNVLIDYKEGQDKILYVAYLN